MSDSSIFDFKQYAENARSAYHEGRSRWEIVYESAIKDAKSPFDESVTEDDLFFKNKLTLSTLQENLVTMGTTPYWCQYNNQPFAPGIQCFKKEWFKYYDTLPEIYHTFAFVDPAISQADSADYTGVVIVHVDANNRWYVSRAHRSKITATQIVELLFDIAEKARPKKIGVEDVAYQRALIHFTTEEMRRRSKYIPIQGVRPPPDKSKQTKILGLVPRFEWGNVFLSRGLHDLEKELLSFPRGSHDDLIDALASIDAITFPPQPEKVKNEKPHSPHDPKYEAWIRANLHKRANSQ